MALRTRPTDEPGAPRPPGHLSSPALTGLFLIVAVHGLFAGRSFFVPVVIAILLSFVLAPSVRALSRLKLPVPLAAALVLSVVIALAGGAVYRLAGPAAAWIDEMPRTMETLQDRLEGLSGPVANVREATDMVEDLATLGNEEEKPQQVEMAGTGLSNSLFELTVGFVAQLLFVLVLLFALLASGDVVLDKLLQITGRVRDRRRIQSIARNTEKQISRYLVTVTSINASLGVATAIMMYLLGMPNPVLWGFMGGLFNFAPFVGTAVTSTVLFLAAATEFSEFGRIILPPLVFLGLTGVEAYFVTPAILARRLTLDLVVVFMTLFSLGSLWGAAGFLLAVPILAVLKIVSDQVDELAPVSHVLGE